MRERSSQNHAGIASSCVSNTPRTNVAARSGLRAGFRGCRPVEPIWVLFCGPPCWWKGSCSGRPGSGFRAQAWRDRCDAKRVNLSRSAIRSRFKRDAKFKRVLDVCLTPPSAATFMRTQRVALSLYFFCETRIPAALVQPFASPLWQAPACHFFAVTSLHRSAS